MRSLGAIVLLAAGCAPPLPPEPVRQPIPETIPQPAPALGCGAGQLQELVGQSRTVLATMRFSQPVRIEEPGMAYTMDYREDRLRILLDGRGTIVRLVCG